MFVVDLCVSLALIVCDYIYLLEIKNAIALDSVHSIYKLKETVMIPPSGWYESHPDIIVLVVLNLVCQIGTKIITLV